ncbi:MAG: hypothetical protein IH800_04190 [Myxococcales bacterium]|nr:hypothetical protein [Myxococcales bacterium]
MPIFKPASTLTLLVLLLASGPALAQEWTDELVDGICPAPISLCGPLSDTRLAPSTAPISVCPAGSVCSCVPSCPACDDCPVQVCVSHGGPECRTACDCEPGLGCFDGRCIAGFAPVFCCDADVCPAGHSCQHRNGRMDRCPDICVDHVWLCDPTSSLPNQGCGDDRSCSCTASCPFCLDCGPPVCVSKTAPVPYRCDDDGGCANPGDQCLCASSAPHLNDCALKVCVPDCDRRCEERVKKVTHRSKRLVRRASRCRRDDQCVQIDPTTECAGACPAWVNRKYARLVEKAIDQLDEEVCSTHQEQGCPYATPGCQLERGACVDRRCVGVPVLPGPRPELEPVDANPAGIQELAESP